MKIKTYILTDAQEASYNGQRVRKTDLDMLQKREEFLRGKIDTKKRGGIRAHGATPA